MHNCLKHLPSRFWIPTLLVFILLTTCTQISTPPPVAAPPITTSSTMLTSFPSPLPPTPTPSAAPTEIWTIQALQMLDRRTGWALGQMGTQGTVRILRTTDSGATWRDVSPGAQSHYDLSVLDGQFAWVHAMENGELWRTQDGGQNWSSLGQIQSTVLRFNDSEHGWKIEAEEWGLSYVQFDILSFSTTQDGGQTWQERNLPPDAGPAFFTFPDSQTAWAIRAWFAKTIEGFPNLSVPFSLVTTVDGARTWGAQDLPLPPETEILEMNDGSYLDAGNCEFHSPVYASKTVWKMALTCEEQGWLYTSIDRGQAWTITPLPEGYATDVQFITPSKGWFLLRDKVHPYQSDLYQTTDGGQSWALRAHTRWATAALDFVDEQAGWALATTCDDSDCNPYFYPKALAKTTDGGTTWQLLEPQVLP